MGIEKLKSKKLVREYKGLSLGLVNPGDVSRISQINKILVNKGEIKNGKI